VCSPGDRFRDGGSTLYRWADPEVLVVCPRCSARAVVRRADGTARRVTCSGCGLTRDADGGSSTWGVPSDPWFGLPLWLQADFRGHTVWAFGAEHLQVLRDFVAAHLREHRPLSGAAMSMLERLPAWMTSAKNRDGVVAVLDRLMDRAGSD
jgi:rubredoxin